MADWLDYWTPGFTRLARDCERLWRRVKIIQEQEREKRKRQKRRERPRMSLFKVKKSPYWQCSITFEGQRIQKSTKFTKSAGAKIRGQPRRETRTQARGHSGAGGAVAVFPVFRRVVS